MKRYKRALSAATLLILIPGCFARRHTIIRKDIYISPTSASSRENTDDPPTITVWVHGTRLFPRTLFRRFFHSEPGLRLAQSLSKEYHLRSIADVLCTQDPTRFDLDHFYLFGWSGKLSFQEREHAAHELYHSLQEKLLEYENRFGQKPSIRIISHSHGGNVVLNLCRFYTDDQPLLIDELILLACPVQEPTRQFIHHKMFIKIHALYSSLDMLQIIDPQGLYEKHSKDDKRPFFSKRLFKHVPKLAQIKVRLNGRAIFHTDFVRHKFMELLPEVLDSIDEWQKQIAWPKAPDEMTRILCVETRPRLFK